MNIRIKELAEQAWDSLIDEMDDVVSEDGSLNSDFLHTYVQRFAELIVRECAFVAQNKDAHKDWLKYGRGLAAGKILEHFGY